MLFITEVQICGAGTIGNTGEPGQDRTEPILQGNSGKNGSKRILDISGYSGIPVAPTLSWLSQYVHSAEVDYANDKLDDCLTKLHWAANLLSVVERSTTLRITDERYLPVRKKIASLTDLIEKGLDVFGRERNYVPLTSFKFNREHTESVLIHARNIEKTLEKLKKSQERQEELLSHTKRVISDLENMIQKNEQILKKEFQAIDELQDSILNLSTMLDELWVELMSANVEFKRAVSKKANCGFENVIQFGLMVTTIVSTVGTGIAAGTSIGTAIDGVKKLNKRPKTTNDGWFERIHNDISAFSEVLKPAGQNISQFRTAFQQAKNEINAVFTEKKKVSPVPGSSSNDYLKLVAAKKDFDREIEPFFNLPEAQKYKRLMDLFVSTAETRNNKIIEHDEKVIRVFGIWSDGDLIRAEISEISSKLEYDFDLPEATNFIERSLKRIKWGIARSINNLAKTVEYLTLEPVVIPIDDQTVASLEIAMTQVREAYRIAIEYFGSSPSEGKGIKIPLTEVLTEQQASKVLAGKSAIFSIRPRDPDLSNPDVRSDPFYPRYAVTTLRISLGDLPANLSNKSFNVQFEHSGRSVLKDRDGILRVYSHQPVRVLFQTNIHGEIVEQGKLVDSLSGVYVGVSPYGPWKIKFSEMAQDDLKKVFETATLVFDIRGRIRPIMAFKVTKSKIRVN